MILSRWYGQLAHCGRSIKFAFINVHVVYHRSCVLLCNDVGDDRLTRKGKAVSRVQLAAVCALLCKAKLLIAPRFVLLVRITSFFCVCSYYYFAIDPGFGYLIPIIYCLIVAPLVHRNRIDLAPDCLHSLHEIIFVSPHSDTHTRPDLTRPRSLSPFVAFAFIDYRHLSLMCFIYPRLCAYMCVCVCSSFFYLNLCLYRLKSNVRCHQF